MSIHAINAPINAAAIALAAIIGLTACGGGGGSAGTTTGGGGAAGNDLPVDDTGPIVRAAGGSSLSLPNAQIRRAFEGIQARATSLNSTDYWSEDGREDVIDCYGATCEIRGTGLESTPSDIDFRNATYSPVMTRNGVSIAQGVTRTSAQFYGGWMDHGAFFIAVGDGGGIGSALGAASGPPPTTGSASYSGVMAGVDILHEEGVQGDALLTADFADYRMDVEFTNVRFVVSGNLHRSRIGFSDVSMFSDGFQKGVRPGDRIRGGFYGPGHDEVGGSFEHGSIIGVFGARRQ